MSASGVGVVDRGGSGGATGAPTSGRSWYSMTVPAGVTAVARPAPTATDGTLSRPAVANCSGVPTIGGGELFGGGHAGQGVRRGHGVRELQGHRDHGGFLR
jgi:hypothetical protein